MSSNGNGERILAAARQLTPMIDSAKAEIERTRCLPNNLVNAMRDAGIFRMWLPAALGGPQLSIAEFVRVIETLSYADGSVGWCAGIGAAYSRFGGFLADAVAARVFNDNILAGSLLPTGRATKVPGGYRVTGRWAWASGISHNDWIIAAVTTYVDDEPFTENGKPEMRIVFFPKSADLEVIDTWKVSGLRGTGSHDFQTKDLFVADEYTLDGLDPPPRHPGGLYAISLNSVFPFVIAAALLGIALAAFDAFLRLASVKAPVSGPTLLRDKPTVQAMVGRSQATLQAAREFYYKTASDVSDWAEAGAPLTLAKRAQVRLAVAQIGETTRQVVRNLQDSAGGSAVYEACPLEQHFRDLQTAAQHVQVSPNNFEFSGRVILGLDPGTGRF